MSVLIADDNATNRSVLQEMLTNWKMHPVVTSNGQEALNELARANAAGHPYGLALLDLQMPDMDGFELTERIRQHPDYRVKTLMMLTSEGQRGHAARCRELGVAAYLMKPVAQSELFDAIMTALGVSQQPLTTRHSLKEMRRRLNLLLAEDNAVNQTLATRLLSKLGHTVTVANNGIEAVQLWQHGSFDAILMDVDMPEMNGYDATLCIREQERQLGEGAHIRIVAMTAHAMQGAREECLLNGMDGYLTKPIDTEALWQELDSLVQRAEVNSPPVEPVAELAVANFQQARQIMDDSRELFDEIASLFLVDVPLHLQQIKDGLLSGESSAVRHSAHTIKGMAGVFAAEATMHFAEQVEKMSGLPECAVEVVQLEAALADLVAAIKAYQW